MAKSFSAFGYKGNEVNGTIIWEDLADNVALVEEGDVLWLVDNLDDVGVSLDAGQILTLLPHLERWATARQQSALNEK